MIDSDNFAEQILLQLEAQGNLFPQFQLTKQNNSLVLLGKGGFSSVYEMYNIERPEKLFALKVMGLERHTVSSREFWETEKLQALLCAESSHVVRILDGRELEVELDENQNLILASDTTRDAWEEAENKLHLQLVIMEKLENILEKDRFKNVSLTRTGLNQESEVIRFALEIAHALYLTHCYKALHRDIKLENIFWDREAQIYKLGDFGIAKYSENGRAETVIYTDGYGAPEIERKSFDSYDMTADIYSFGITLYLLLNELRFPASDGYYPRVEVQYHPGFIFPAPMHASVEMVRIIRKMCNYYPEDRYQDMGAVLQDLLEVSHGCNTEIPKALEDLISQVTETYREDNVNGGKSEFSEDDFKTDTEEGMRNLSRAERLKQRAEIERNYSRLSKLYFVILTILGTLMMNGFLMKNYENVPYAELIFWGIPLILLLEAVLAHIREFHIIWGIVSLTIVIVSIVQTGFSTMHILAMVALVSVCPVVLLSVATSIGLWLLFAHMRWLPSFAFCSGTLKWIVLVAFTIAVIRYLLLRIAAGRGTIFHSEDEIV